MKIKKELKEKKLAEKVFRTDTFRGQPRANWYSSNAY